MTQKDFFSVVDDIVADVATRAGKKKGARSQNWPLQYTRYARRRDRLRWDVLTGPPAARLEAEDYHEVRQKLSSIKMADGLRCLSDAELAKMDEAWAVYQRMTLVAGEAVPKAFKIIAQDFTHSHFSDVEFFRDVLKRALYRPMLEGDHAKCRDNLGALLAGFKNDETIFPRGSRHRTWQLAELLRTAQFCMYRAADPLEHGIVEYATLAYQATGNLDFRQTCVAHAFFYNKGSRPGALALQIGLSKAKGGVVGNVHQAALLVRAASEAATEGFRLEDTPPALNGLSVGDSFLKAAEIAQVNGRLVEGALFSLLRTRAVARQGSIDAALQEAIQVRSGAEGGLGDLGKSPHLEAGMIVAEAEIFFEASRGEDKSLILAATGKVEQLRRLAVKHNGLGFVTHSDRVIRKISKSASEKLGLII